MEEVNYVKSKDVGKGRDLLPTVSKVVALKLIRNKS